jgi:hypothetical protein
MMDAWVEWPDKMKSWRDDEERNRQGDRMQKHGERECTRCTETISMLNKEEMRVVVERISGVEKEDCVGAEIHRRGMVH